MAVAVLLLVLVGPEVTVVVDRRARADRGVVQESIPVGSRGRCRDRLGVVVLDVEAVPVEGEILEV